MKQRYNYMKKSTGNISPDSNDQILISDIENVINTIYDKIEMDARQYAYFLRLSRKYQAYIVNLRKGKSPIEYYQNLLDNAEKKGSSISDIRKARYGLLGALYAKYSKIQSDGSRVHGLDFEKKDVDRIFKELDQIVIRYSFVCEDGREKRLLEQCFYRWMDLAKREGRTIRDGLIVAKNWVNFVEKENIYDDMRPYYYRYVLSCLSALEGNLEDVKQLQHYKEICSSKVKGMIFKPDRIRDFLLDGKDMKQLCDIKTIENLDINTLDKLPFKRFSGMYYRNESHKGFIKIEEPDRLRQMSVKFNLMVNNDIGKQQIGHKLNFGIGFSFEGFIAVDSSVKSLNNIENRRE